MKKLLFSIAVLFLLSVVGILSSCGADGLTLSWHSPEKPKVSTNILLKVYMENSGSMNGYMCDSSQLKDAVKSYISSVDPYVDSLSLNYINTKIINRGSNIKNYVSTMNPKSFRKAGGNTANSDIANMLEKILLERDSNEITVFVSDCIMDVPQGTATDFFTDRQIDIRNAFSKHLRVNSNLAVEVYRMISIYKGNYYYYNGFENNLEAERPYFMFVMGDKHILAHLKNHVPDSYIKHGVSNYFAYSTPEEIPIEITNQHGQPTTRPGECYGKSSRGEYQFNVKMDMSSTLQDDNILCDVTNYSKLGGNMTINKITPVADKKSCYTHILNVSFKDGTKSYGEMIDVKAHEMPDWIDSVNDDTGKDIKNNLNKTTGIKYIVGGISDAYKEFSTVASIKFVVKNN